MSSDPEKNVIMLAMLREQFGSDTLEQALNLLVACAAPVVTVNQPITDADLGPRASQPRGEIRILGWGSLLWEKDETADKTSAERHENYRKLHENWEPEGPTLPLEFSRVSSSRDGALTIVIDRDHGRPVKVSSARSRQTSLTDAIKDLHVREKAESEEQIGYVDLVSGDHGGRNDEDTRKTVEEWAKGNWAKEHGVTAVIWSDFEPNFEKEKGQPWSVKNALDYIRSLNGDALQMARKYIRDAPEFVRTAFREAAAEQEKKIPPWDRP